MTKLHVADPNMRAPSTALVILAGALSCGGFGCSKLGPSDGTPSTAGPSHALSAVRAGDRVIIESATATFVEGVVVSMVRDRANVELGGGDVSERALADLYVPALDDAPPSAPATAEPSPNDARASGEPWLRPGSYAVCRIAGTWRGCRIEAVGSVVHVVDENAAAFDVPWRDFLAPTPVTELNVRQRFERNAKRRAFRDGARSAGRPRLPPNWQPAMNERVIVERDGTWVGAQVKGVRKGAIRVEWDADHRRSDAPRADVVPEPPIDFAPTVGTYVLARPAGGMRAWPVMRVESTGTANVEVSDELGDRHPMAIRDVLPLEHGL